RNDSMLPRPVLAVPLLGVLTLLLACSASTPVAGPPPSNGGSPVSGPTRVPQVTVRVRTLPIAVSRAVAVSSGGDVLVAGGLDSTGTSTDAIYRLDPTTDRLTRIGRLAEPTHDAAGAVLRGRLYVFGGGRTRSV